MLRRWWGCERHQLQHPAKRAFSGVQSFQTYCSHEGQMNDYTTMIYVVEDGAWWSFTAKQWIAFFPLALACMRSGAGYGLPNKNRMSGPPMCAQRIDDEDAWYSNRNDTEIFYLRGWNLEAWEEEFAIMQESGLLD
jgi:hypothetical protein